MNDIKIVVMTAFLLAASKVCVMATGISPDSAYAVVNVSVCNMREQGKFTSSMSTQALLGTPVKVKQFKGWYQIQTPDNYTGWVHRLVVKPMNKRQMDEWNDSEKVVVTAHYGFAYECPNEGSNPVSDVVAGNRLKWLDTVKGFYKVAYPDGRVAYLSKKISKREDVWRKHLTMDADAILQTALSMKGVPYIWAGMSSKGVDCSGFVRTVLFMHDIIIPRDASQQAKVGERIEIDSDYSNIKPGDLVFFGRKKHGEKEESVSHVGIYMGGKRFIHSLGDVRVASFCPEEKDYDAFNTGRLLFAVRFLPYVNVEEDLNTTATNAYYVNK